MEQRIAFIFCTVLLAALVSQNEAKSYRTDYEYDWRTDAFYKLHVDSDSKLQRRQVCELEGAELMPPISEQQLSQLVRANFNQYRSPTEEDGDLQQNNAAGDKTIVDYSEAQDVLQMSCQVTTQEGQVKTSSVFRNKHFFICKVKAKDVTYNSQCRVHVKGYRFVPSVGSCYKITRVAYIWDQAAAECQAEGAHLAVINSAQEARELKTIMASVEDVPDSVSKLHFLVGFRAEKLTKPKVFRTIYNETLEAAGYNVWANNEPNNYANYDENCGSIERNEGKLNDISCSIHYGFICEKEVVYRI